MRSTTTIELNQSHLLRIEAHWKKRLFYHIGQCLGDSKNAVHFNLALNQAKSIKDVKSNGPKEFRTTSEALDYLNLRRKNFPNDTDLFNKAEIIKYFSSNFPALAAFIEENISSSDQVKYRAVLMYALGKVFSEEEYPEFSLKNLLASAREKRGSLGHEMSISKIQNRVRRAAYQRIVEEMQNKLAKNPLIDLRTYLDNHQFKSGNKAKIRSPHKDKQAFIEPRIVPKHVAKIYAYLEEKTLHKRSPHSALCRSIETILIASASNSCRRAPENAAFYKDASDNIQTTTGIDVKASINMMRKYINDLYPNEKQKSWLKKVFYPSTKTQAVKEIEKKLRKGKYKKALILAHQNAECFNPFRNRKEQELYENLCLQLMFHRKELLLKDEKRTPNKPTVPKISGMPTTPDAEYSRDSLETPTTADVRKAAEFRRQNPKGVGRKMVDTYNVDGSPTSDGEESSEHSSPYSPTDSSTHSEGSEFDSPKPLYQQNKKGTPNSPFCPTVHPKKEAYSLIDVKESVGYFSSGDEDYDSEDEYSNGSSSQEGTPLINRSKQPSKSVGRALFEFLSPRKSNPSSYSSSYLSSEPSEKSSRESPHPSPTSSPYLKRKK